MSNDKADTIGEQHPAEARTTYFGALPREAQLSEPTSRLNEGIFAHADFDDVDS